MTNKEIAKKIATSIHWDRLDESELERNTRIVEKALNEAEERALRRAADRLSKKLETIDIHELIGDYHEEIIESVLTIPTESKAE